MKSPDKNKSLLGVFILLGAILGSIAGEILGSSFTKLSFLKTAYKVGTTSPLNLDLKVFKFSYRFKF
ncbi:membrane protein [Clostridium botulinum A1 str. CFSAN002368]|nr:membrane protein [Clostridium botulinum A1 str. CFSAN002368]